MRLLYAIVLTLLLVVSADDSAAQSQSEPIRITPLVSGVDASFRGMAVRNSREAWVAGTKGTVIRTTDSGTTWQRVAVPDTDESDFRDVEVLADGTVLLMSVGEGTASKLFRSTDDGETWRTVLVNSEPAGFFDGIAFREDGKFGILFGDPVNGRLDIYMTLDGGTSWKRLPEKQRPKLKEGEYGFAASGTGVVFKGRNVWIATGGSIARVWHSGDEGLTWQPHDTKIRSGNESSGIFSIDFIDDAFGVAIGGDYKQPKIDRANVSVTMDGGVTWRSSENVSMPHKACVQSLSGGRYLTCGRTGVAFSKDAGKTWDTVTSDGFYTLRADLSSGSGFLAGKNGRIACFQLVVDEE